MRLSIILSSTLLGLGLTASIPANDTKFNVTKLDTHLSTAQKMTGGGSFEPNMRPFGPCWTSPQIAAADPEAEDLPVLDLSWMAAGDLADPADNANYICDTTAGSPRLHDIDKVYNVLMTVPNSWCTNSNKFGSKCTNIARIANSNGVYAAVSLCGKQFKVNCAQVAVAVMGIKSKCTWTLYAGGRWFFAGDQIVALHK